ncbi:hypothetical protein D3C75_736790 [compost metagenome]
MFGVNISPQLLQFPVQLLHIARVHEETLQQHIAPIVGDPLLPIGRFGRLQWLIVPIPGAIVIPREEIPGLRVLGAVQHVILADGIQIPHEDIDAHPGQHVVPVEVGFDHLIDVQAVIIDLIQHMEQLVMVGISLDAEDLLEGGFVVFRVGHESKRLGIPVEGEVGSLVQAAVGIEAMLLQIVLARIFNFRIKPVILEALRRIALGQVPHIQVDKMSPQAGGVRKQLIIVKA